MKKTAETIQSWESGQAFPTYIQVKKKNSGGGNYYSTQVSYLGKQYLDLAFGKYYQNQISVGQLADYLNVRVSSISGLEEAMSRVAELAEV